MKYQFRVLKIFQVETTRGVMTQILTPSSGAFLVVGVVRLTAFFAVVTMFLGEVTG
jgi:hypothetical protein